MMKKSGWIKIACMVLMLSILVSAAGVAAADQALLKLNFSKKTGLQFYLQEGGHGQLDYLNGTAVVDIYDPGMVEWAVQAYRTELTLTQGTTYELSFDMCSTADREVSLAFQHTGGDWHTYAAETFEVTKTMTRYTYKFKMDEKTDITSQLVFNMGWFESLMGTSAEKHHKISIDNILLKVAE